MSRLLNVLFAALFLSGIAETHVAAALEPAAANDSLYSNDALLNMLIDTTLINNVIEDVKLPVVPEKPKYTPPARSRRQRWREPGYWKDPSKLPIDTTIDASYLKIPRWLLMPPVYNSYDIKTPELTADPLNRPVPPDASKPGAWADRLVAGNNYWNSFMQSWMIAHPRMVPNNAALMQRPPQAVVLDTDPSKAKITVRGFDSSPEKLKEAAQAEANIQRINWIHTFDGSLQFSQAYISPNWYQGGNSNLNMIANAIWNLKLNPAFHPNLIFETSVSYKLGVNNAPDDSLHQYNISDDIFQVNSKFGVRAFRKWFYSVNVLFKTQLFNNYKKNSADLAAAFLSPGEFNVGIGMTYSNANPKKTVEFNASVAPFSYNLKTCTNERIDPKQFGIDRGHTTVSQFGSSAELTFRWKMRYNIQYYSRMFIFTNYEYVQGDWENTIDFAISRFFSTKIYAHLRYDSSTKKVAGTEWHQWQLKEILSIGFSYKFALG